MLHHLPSSVFLTCRDLPPTCQPAHVVRYDGMTLVMLDPHSLRAELAFWCRDNLTADEQVAIRVAYGMSGDLSEPIPDDILDGEMGHDVLPTAVRLPDLIGWQQTA